MPPYLPRILYLIAGFAWLLLLWPNQITLFMAASMSCLTLPFYRRLRLGTINFRKSWKTAKGLGQAQPSACALVPAFSGYRIRFSRLCFACLCRFRPSSIWSHRRPSQDLPSCGAAGQQFPAAAGLGGVFPERSAMRFPEYPRLEKIINETLTNLDTMFTDAVGILVSPQF